MLTHPDLAGNLAVPVLLVALAYVVVSDLLYRRIPNWLGVLLLSTWLAHTAAKFWLAGLPGLPAGTLTGLVTALLVLLMGYVLFAMRWVGAGDIKLLSVLSLWFASAAPAFLIVTSLAGGVLVLLMPLVRIAENACAHMIHGINLLLPWLRIPAPVSLGSAPVNGLPYGLAISAGALYVLY